VCRIKSLIDIFSIDGSPSFQENGEKSQLDLKFFLSFEFEYRNHRTIKGDENFGFGYAT
jgi:hypothetical protein